MSTKYPSAATATASRAERGIAELSVMRPRRYYTGAERSRPCESARMNAFFNI
jgi:hypothetical protein